MTTPSENNDTAAAKISSGLDRIAGRPVRRSHSNRWLTGVCGGLGEAFNVDPNIVRLITAIGTVILTPVFLVLYIGLAIVLPKS